MRRKILDKLTLAALLLIISLGFFYGGSSTEGDFIRQIVNILSAFFLIIFVILTPSVIIQRIPAVINRLLFLGLSFIAIQLIPFHPSIWTALPGRDNIVEELVLFNQPLGWRPLSMAPLRTLNYIMELFPGILAIYLACISSRFVVRWMFVLFTVFALINLIWGFAQVYSNGDPSLYIWSHTNLGSPTGSFANVNHQATLMLIALPLIAYVCKYYSASSLKDRYGFSPLLLGLALWLLCIACIVMVKSTAGYLIAIPTIYLSILILVGKNVSLLRRLSKYSFIIISCLGVFFVLLTDLSHVQELGAAESPEVSTSRHEITKVSLKMLETHWVFGIGAGAYADVNQSFEDRLSVTSTYINHAHNDYLEIMIELGVLGLFFMILSLAIILKAAIKNWLGLYSSNDYLLRAASVIIFVLLLHSVFDYPLRSQFLFVVFSFSVGVVLRQSDEHKVKM